MRATVLLALCLAGLACTCKPVSTQPASQPASRPSDRKHTVRCVAIGGMTETGFWAALSERFEKDTGIHVELVTTGTKGDLAKSFREGQADLITMHSSDLMMHLVADGLAMDPQPWLKNDLLIVGPADDPAGIRGMTSAAAALKKIIATKNTFVIHSSLGVNEVLRGICHSADIHFDPDHTILRLDEQPRQILQFSADHHAYTAVGRIPFLSGKMPNKGLVIMVQGDPQMRRPYVVAIADPKHFPHANVAAAKKLENYMRLPTTQAWIAEYGRGKFDEYPIFVAIGARVAQPTPTSAPAR